MTLQSIVQSLVRFKNQDAFYAAHTNVFPLFEVFHNLRFQQLNIHSYWEVFSQHLPKGVVKHLISKHHRNMIAYVDLIADTASGFNNNKVGTWLELINKEYHLSLGDETLCQSALVVFSGAVKHVLPQVNY